MANGIYDLIDRNLNSAMDEYSQKVYGPNGIAFNSPNKLQYDIDANAAAARVPSQVLEQIYPGITGQLYGTLSDLAMPAFALGSSPFYDMYQAGDRARAEYGIFNDSDPNVLGVTGDSEIPMGPSFNEYARAVAAENIPSSMMGRTLGAGQNLADRIESGNFPLSLNNVMDMGRSIKDNVGNFFFSPAGAAEISPTTNRNFDRDFSQLGDADSFRSRMERMSERPSENTLQARQASSARSLGMDKEIEKEEGIFSLGDILADLGSKGVEIFKDVADRTIKSQAYGGVGTILGGPVVGGIGALAGLLTGGNMFNSSPSQSQITFDNMTPGQQAYTSSLYNPGQLLSGYNQISASGVGALGTLQNRLGTIQNTLAKQKNPSLVLQQREQQIKDAIDKSINIGESEALQDPNRNVGGIRTDIDVADGGAETSGGKIVCTMMNESYGFGNFRNKIWLKHSKNLPKEYEIGYHKIFLPLVKFAKGQGKLNKAVKKTLEHVARHRTLDLKQEMKGKTHLLGRIYRKILEPICFIVGKISNND